MLSVSATAEERERITLFILGFFVFSSLPEWRVFGTCLVLGSNLLDSERILFFFEYFSRFVGDVGVRRFLPIYLANLEG